MTVDLKVDGYDGWRRSAATSCRVDVEASLIPTVQICAVSVSANQTLA